MGQLSELYDCMEGRGGVESPTESSYGGEERSV